MKSATFSPLLSLACSHAAETWSLDHPPAGLPFKSSDIRFTEGKDDSLCVGCMTVPAPGETLKIKSLGTGGKVDHKQEADARSISCPGEMPFQHAVGFKIVFQQEQ